MNPMPHIIRVLLIIQLGCTVTHGASGIRKRKRISAEPYATGSCVELKEILTRYKSGTSKLRSGVNKGKLGLHVASFLGCDRVVHMILEKELGLSFRDSTVRGLSFRQRISKTDEPLQNTALHYAVMQGHQKVVDLLISNHASLYTRNSEGKSPCDVAKALKESSPPGNIYSTIWDSLDKGHMDVSATIPKLRPLPKNLTAIEKAFIGERISEEDIKKNDWGVEPGLRRKKMKTRQMTRSKSSSSISSSFSPRRSQRQKNAINGIHFPSFRGGVTKRLGNRSLTVLPQSSSVFAIDSVFSIGKVLVARRVKPSTPLAPGFIEVCWDGPYFVDAVKYGCHSAVKDGCQKSLRMVFKVGEDDSIEDQRVVHVSRLCDYREDFVGTLQTIKPKYNEDGLFIPEKIVQHRIQKGSTEYLVKWVGFDVRF